MAPKTPGSDPIPPNYAPGSDPIPPDAAPIPTITPSALWLAHRAAAGGKSTMTGAPLPATLDDCAPGPQETHYAMAVYVATAHGERGVVPVPPKVSPERAEVLRVAAEGMAKGSR